MRDSNVRKVRVNGFYNLVIVVPKLLKLEIKVIQTGNKLHFRRVAFDDNELLGEDAFDDNRLRLCSNPALQSICLKRIFSSVVSLKLYLWTLGSVVVGRPILFFVVVINLVV